MTGRRDPVVLAWGLGLGLAVLAYAIGPRNFLFQVTDWLHYAAWRLGEAIQDLSVVTLDLVRAVAIGLYATFVLLAVAVIRRGGRSRAALVVVTVLFLVLIGPTEQVTESNGRWAAALAISAVGALSMTNRLRQTALVPRAF